MKALYEATSSQARLARRWSQAVTALGRHANPPDTLIPVVALTITLGGRPRRCSP
jgi:hypothetical protein